MEIMKTVQLLTHSQPMLLNGLISTETDMETTLLEDCMTCSQRIPTQWEDEDGDGLGDNQSGTDADPYLNDFDNDGYNDTIDILPRLASPGDLDADGCMDEDDAFVDNALECLDTDGDGIGDNADADDDNDEWTDADEIRAGTDPLNANDTPVDSFEIVIPGNIGLRCLGLNRYLWWCTDFHLVSIRIRNQK